MNKNLINQFNDCIQILKIIILLKIFIKIKSIANYFYYFKFSKKFKKF